MEFMNAMASRAGLAVSAGALLIMAAGGAHACTDQAIKRLAEIGVGKSAITGVWVYRESTQEGGLQGYKAWARLESCKGYAVVDMDSHCRPFQVYTTRDCRISGAPSY